MDWEKCTSSCDRCPFCYSFSGDQALKRASSLACYRGRSGKRILKRLPNKLLTTSARLDSLSLFAVQLPLTDYSQGNTSLRLKRAHPAEPSTSKALESGHVGAMHGTSSRHLWVRWTRCLILGAVVKEQQPSKSLFPPAGIPRAALYPSQTVHSFIIQAQRTAWLALAAKLNPVPLFVTGHDYDISVSLTIEETMLTRINPGMLFTNDCTVADPHIK